MPEATGPAGSTGGSDSAGRRPVAVVTGASRGIGAHLALGFAAAGYEVFGCSRSADPARSDRPVGGDAPRAEPVITALDVTDERAVHDWIADILARVPAVDVLVNNAGVIDTEVPLEESDPQEWWRAVEVNVRGPYLVTRMVLPGMLAAGSGRVINLNSGSGTRAGAQASAYNVGKTALARITGSTHLSGRAAGVRAFDLAPGVVRTDMTAAMPKHRDRTQWTSPQEVLELALALASGRLDAWSGRMVRAGVDHPDELARRAAAGLGPAVRTLALMPWGEDDPLA